MTPEQFNADCAAYAQREGKKLLAALGNSAGTGMGAALFVALRATRAAELYSQQLGERLAVIEERLREVETAAIKYVGVYQPGKSYSAGEWVSWSGSVWSATRDVQGISPSSKSDAWLKSISRGNDGASAYRSAIKHGFVGSESDWIKTLQGKA